LPLLTFVLTRLRGPGRMLCCRLGTMAKKMAAKIASDRRGGKKTIGNA
jgi:hypothetical protein